MSSASRVARPLLLSRLQTAPLRRGQTRALATGDSLRRTPLYDLHQRHGAKTGPFAGFDMPLSYAKHGHAAEHKACRTAAALFDVSHMVQWTFVIDQSALRLIVQAEREERFTLPRSPYTGVGVVPRLSG